MHQKAFLPSKVCAVCQRPFVWRKRWARCWDEVRYCSDRCRGQRHTTPPALSPEEKPPAKKRAKDRPSPRT